MDNKAVLPIVALTQQDFVSTFPWGIRGDRVRIIQQETENALLDAEAAAAMAVTLGSPGFSANVERAWKLYLNSQNHDVHVCLRDEAGVEWCEEAREIALQVRAEAGAYIAGRAGGDVSINTMSRERDGIPAFGFAPFAKTAEAAQTSASGAPLKGGVAAAGIWDGWYQGGCYRARAGENGAIIIEIAKAQSCNPDCKADRSWDREQDGASGGKADDASGEAPDGKTDGGLGSVSSEAQDGCRDGKQDSNPGSESGEEPDDASDGKANGIRDNNPHDTHDERRFYGMCEIGYLTVYADGAYHDTRDERPAKIKATTDGATARLQTKGLLGGVAYELDFMLSHDGIDVDAEFDYGDGCNFGPDIADIETEPRRAHYFQHEKKLCINWRFDEAPARVLYNSPFLTWPADADARSIESLGSLAMEADGYGVAHLNAGQFGYGIRREDNSCAHTLSFAPRDYVYGKIDKLTLTGRHIHNCRFIPYAGDWRAAKLPLKTQEFMRPPFRARAASADGKETESACLLSVIADSTAATALFERDGRVYARLWEWAGQADTVELRSGSGGGGGDARQAFIECTHGLKPVGPINATFAMRPWEIKTVEITKAENIAQPPSQITARPSKPPFAQEPEGWGTVNRFRNREPVTNTANQQTDGAVLYFSSGYHDGFVNPLIHPTPTMLVEMERVRRYKGYTNTWELGGSCFDSFGRNDPQFLEDLKQYLADGSIEIVGGTWCEPFGLIVSGESNIRQMLYGTEAIRRTLGTDILVYSNQEHGTYAQQPQILTSFGVAAAVNRTQWSPYGYESAVDADAVIWKSPDGTEIVMIPRYNSMDYTTCPWDTISVQNASITGHYRIWREEGKYEEMLDSALRLGVRRPLMTMLEDIWDVKLRTTDAEMDMYASLPKMKFISVASYLKMIGAIVGPATIK